MHHRIEESLVRENNEDTFWKQKCVLSVRGYAKLYIVLLGCVLRVVVHTWAGKSDHRVHFYANFLSVWVDYYIWYFLIWGGLYPFGALSCDPNLHLWKRKICIDWQISEYWLWAVEEIIIQWDKKQNTKTKPVAYPGWHTPGGGAKPRMSFWRPWVNLKMAPLGRGGGWGQGTQFDIL